MSSKRNYDVGVEFKTIYIKFRPPLLDGPSSLFARIIQWDDGYTLVCLKVEVAKIRMLDGTIATYDIVVNDVGSTINRDDKYGTADLAEAAYYSYISSIYCLP